MADDPGQVVEEAQAIDHNGELLDEVLQQSSAQALRITHVDEKVSEVKETLGALCDDVAAIKVASQNMAGAGRTQAGPDNVAAQLDHLEHETKALKGRLGMVLGVSAVQVLALIGLMVFALKPLPHNESAPAEPALTAVAPKPQPAPAPAPAEVATSDNLLQNAPSNVAPGGAPPADKGKEKDKEKGKKKKK